jgi:hypothetical protein
MTTASDSAVLAGPDHLTAAWLTGVLGLPDGAEVTGVDVTPVGTGQMADTVRARLSYQPAGAGPDSVVVKFASSDERSRSAGALVRAYEIEVAIYSQLAPLPGVPRCHHAAHDPNSGDFTIVLEDMTPCVTGDDLIGSDPERARACLRALAQVHAHAWEDPALAEHEWLNRASPEQRVRMTGLVSMLAPMFLDRFGPLLNDEHRALAERMIPKLDVINDAYQGPRTLTHGDYRLDNLLFRDGAPAPAIVDWQTAVWGAAASDVSYFLGGSLHPEVRREHAGQLLDTYHEALVAAGVNGYSREDLERDVRVLSFGGVVMAFAAAVLVVQTERGDAMFAGMFARHAQHVLDLDAEGVLPERPAHAASGDTEAGPAAGHEVDPADEAGHSPGGEQLWNESWYADAVTADGSAGVYVRLGRYPNLGVTWWHAVVVGAGQPLVVTARTDLAVTDRTEIRADGVSVDLIVDEPLRTFAVRGAMTAARLADPAGVYAGQAGEPVELVIDATWRTDGVPYHYGITTRYEIPCAVRGSVTVDGQRIPLDGPGQRDHSWGVRDWWSMSWCWSAGHLTDGTHLHLTDVRTDSIRFAAGYQQRDGRVTPLGSGRVEEELGEHGFPTVARATMDGMTVTIEPVAFGPVLLPAPDGRVGRFPRAVARFSTDDGRVGTGWVEWNQP